MFKVCGPIENVTIAVDDMNRSKGTAFVTYRYPGMKLLVVVMEIENARKAVHILNDKKLLQNVITVTLLSSNATTSSFHLEENEDSGISISKQNRNEIMKKLASNKDSDFIQHQQILGQPDSVWSSRSFLYV